MNEPPSIVDPDGLPPYNWSPAWGDRVFWFDAFISHNRHDGSAGLQERLGAAGVRAWHDSDASLADRKVQERIALALMHSRHVVVYIRRAFQDSTWCKAEYLPALQAGRLAGAERVLVAVADSDAFVPAELQACRRFDLHEGGLENLSDFLRERNRLEFDPAEVLNAAKPWDVPEPSHDQAWGSLPETIASGSGLISTTLLRDNLCLLLDRAREGHGAIDDCDQPLMAVCGMLQRVADRGAVPDAIIALYRRVARVFTDSPDNDARANALMIFERIADLRPGAQAIRDVIEFLRREKHEGIIGTTRAWLGKDPLRWSDEDRRVLQLAVLRGSNYFRKQETANLVATFPEAVRLRVQIPAGVAHADEVLQRSLFSAEEALLRLEERLDHIVWKEMEPMETELFLVELDKTGRKLLDDEASPGRQAVLSRLVEMYARIVPFSLQHGGRPLTDMDVSAYAWFLMKLSRMVDPPEIRARAIDICRRACEVLERYGPSEKDKMSAQAFQQHLQRLMEGADLDASEMIFEIALTDIHTSPERSRSRPAR